MLRVPFESSALASALYRLQSRELDVEFRSGEIHRYSDVPPQTYTELLEAESKGAYYNFNIRNRFRFRRLTSAHALPAHTA